MNVLIRVLSLLVISIFIVNTLYSRDYSPKLLEKYSYEELKQLETDSPEQFELLSYFVESGYYFMEMPEKAIQYEILKKVDLSTGKIDEGYVITEKDLNDFNPLSYNCNFKDLIRSYYKVGETGMLLVIPTTIELRIAIENKKRMEKKK